MYQAKLNKVCRYTEDGFILLIFMNLYLQIDL